MLPDIFCLAVSGLRGSFKLCRKYARDPRALAAGAERVQSSKIRYVLGLHRYRLPQDTVESAGVVRIRQVVRTPVRQPIKTLHSRRNRPLDSFVTFTSLCHFPPCLATGGIYSNLDISRDILIHPHVESVLTNQKGITMARLPFMQGKNTSSVSLADMASSVLTIIQQHQQQNHRVYQTTS